MAIVVGDLGRLLRKELLRGVLETQLGRELHRLGRAAGELVNKPRRLRLLGRAPRLGRHRRLDCLKRQLVRDGLTQIVTSFEFLYHPL